jgi:hypothetical protein
MMGKATMLPVGMTVLSLTGRSAPRDPMTGQEHLADPSEAPQLMWLRHHVDR